MKMAKIFLAGCNFSFLANAHIKLFFGEYFGSFFLALRLCKHREKVFYCFYTITCPRKKRKTLCMALIKREILTSRKILSARSGTRNQFLFCKKMVCKIRIFLA